MNVTIRHWLWMVLLGLLIGCQSNPLVTDKNHQTGKSTRAHIKKSTAPTEQDGPPSGPIPRFFKAVKPIFEPLSRYGNPDVYHVNGKTYTVMTNSTGYHQRGLASWYGTKFHSKRTSSGDNYNMYALTAAHRTLPLPTYVRVKNLNNGRVAIVKVNDRGPFHSDRIIDLSYAAAVKLGLLPKGTAPVEIEALSLTPKGKSREAHYYLQAGAFSSAQFAQSLRNKITKISRSPVVVEKYKQRFIVRVGPFANKAMSDQLKRTLAKQGIHGSFSVLM